MPPIIGRQAAHRRACPGFETDSIFVAGEPANIVRTLAARNAQRARLHARGGTPRGARWPCSGCEHRRSAVSRRAGRRQQVMVDGAEYTVVGVFAKAKGGFFGENGLDRQITHPAAHRARSAIRRLDRYHDHRQGPARPAPAGLSRRSRTSSGKSAARRPGDENDFSLTTAGPDHQAVRPHHRADRDGLDRDLRRWACWWAASA